MHEQTTSSIWKGRIDHETDPMHFRNFQVVEHVHKDNPVFCDVGILGYAVDQGVELNQGRIGSSTGPNAIRQKFANMSYIDKTIADFGNVSTREDSVEDVQKEFAKIMKATYDFSDIHFLLGGGHDISYAHYLGLKAIYPDKRIGVINIDAHFDLRTSREANSGTGFKQILDDDKDVGYLVLGIQPSGNTKHLFEVAKATNTEYVLATDINACAKGAIDHFVKEYDIIMLTICLDVLDAGFAPGVSAPCSFGLSPYQVDAMIQHIMQFNKTKHISIAEMNPKYDIDGRTAKLVAHLMYNITNRNANMI
ncbi:formimidoylglutamase [Macrococcus sp. DPC7161]|uniref:formimidoylglutamase n=1 Tax=Macrococcus sp. DPC7161 TaxID=2507060 RepID=UPI00100B4D5C|nr:formimidoylglutamase [Macrococcus sp. DPC7161]RXK18316.1 formimidoylglutamase [Macrococcus sp. DPC7161]